MGVIGVQETHIKGCGVIDCMMGSESEVWEGMEGRVVLCGVDVKSKGIGKEGYALLMSSEDMGRHRDTWMEGVQDSVGRWKGRNSEICMGQCVCTCKCEKRRGEINF